MTNGKIRREKQQVLCTSLTALGGDTVIPILLKGTVRFKEVMCPANKR